MVAAATAVAVMPDLATGAALAVATALRAAAAAGEAGATGGVLPGVDMASVESVASMALAAFACQLQLDRFARSNAVIPLQGIRAPHNK